MIEKNLKFICYNSFLNCNQFEIDYRDINNEIIDYIYKLEKFKIDVIFTDDIYISFVKHDFSY